MNVVDYQKNIVRQNNLDKICTEFPNDNLLKETAFQIHLALFENVSAHKPNNW